MKTNFNEAPRRAPSLKLWSTSDKQRGIGWKYFVASHEVFKSFIRLWRDKSVLTGILGWCVLTASAQDKQEVRNVGDFTKIKAKGAYEIYIQQADSNAVKITSESEEAIKNTKTVVNKGVLEIYSEDRINTKEMPEIHIRIKSVESIIVSGACKVRSDNTLTPAKLYIESSGAGAVNLDIKAESVKTEISGAGMVKLTGSAAFLDANIHGAGTLKATDLETDKAAAVVSGAGTARVYAKTSLTADVSGAGSVIYKGDPQDRNVTASGAGSVRQSITGTGEETEPGTTNPDTTKIRWKNKKIFIMNERDKKCLDSLGHRKPDCEEKYGSNHHYKTHGNNDDFKHWAGLDLGINGYLNSKNEINLPSTYNFMELDYGKSIHFAINLFEKDIHLVRNNLNLVTGLGFDFNTYAFKNPITLSPSSDPIVAYTDTSVQYDKNKLKMSFVTVPLLLEFNAGHRPRKAFHLAAGITGAYKLGSKTKQAYDIGAYEYKIKRKDDYNLSPFRASATVRAGVGKFTLYANYALTELFEKNKGPKLFPFSVGVRVIGF